MIDDIAEPNAATAATGTTTGLDAVPDLDPVDLGVGTVLEPGWGFRTSPLLRGIWIAPLGTGPGVYQFEGGPIVRIEDRVAVELDGEDVGVWNRGTIPLQLTWLLAE